MAPVHIGGGHTYNSKEYIYEDGAYYFPDMVKMYTVIRKRGKQTLKNYEDFLQLNLKRNPKRLLDFLKDNNISDRDFGGYRINETGFEVEQKKNRGKINEVDAFIKDPYGNPYIPGSSLKGAIRTLVQNFKGSLNDEQANKLFSNILVSDSKTINFEHLILTQKWDYNKEKDSPRQIPVFRESLAPFTRVEFTIDAVGEEAIQVINNLKKLSEYHYEKYHSHFLREFSKDYIQNNYLSPIYIGAGSGFWTKVIINKGDLSRYQSRSSKTRMKGKGVLKLTKARKKKFKFQGKEQYVSNNKDNFYEMGKCNFLVKKIEE